MGQKSSQFTEEELNDYQVIKNKITVSIVLYKTGVRYSDI